MFKNRASIVAVMGLLSLLIQFGCDPLGLMTPAGNQLTNASYLSPNGTGFQSSNVAGGNPYLTQNGVSAYPNGYGAPASTGGYSGNTGSMGNVNSPPGYGNAYASTGSQQPYASYPQGQLAGYSNPAQTQPQYTPQFQSQQQQPTNYFAPGSNGTLVPINSSNATNGAAAQPYLQSVAFDNRSLLIASFNIRVFGVSKVGDSDTTRILVDIVRRFDLIAIQELRSTDQQVLDRFLAMVNAEGGTYRYVVGERLGYTISKEQYVYIFDAAKLRVMEQPFTVPDPTGAMHRPPLATRFKSLELPENQAFSFTLLNVHTDPDNVINELKALQYVVASVRQNMPYEDDVIILGDFNAPTRQIDTCQWLPYQFAAIRDNWPTNVREDRNYDNLVFDGQATNEFTGKSGVLNFRQFYQLQLEDAQDVSDHFPVWGEFSIFENRNAAVAGGQTWPVSR